MITVILLYARLSLVSQPKPLLFCVSLSYRRLALFGETKNPKESNFAERLIQTKILSLSVVAVAKRGQKKKGRRGHNGVADGYQQPYYFHQGPYFLLCLKTFQFVSDIGIHL